jgi:myo-inositol 2-dehydrogenase/D-chiro-inositol 1-dehydrogenase
VGLIGAGRIGRLHAEHLAHRIPETNLLAIADLDEQAAQHCARQCSIPKVTTDYRTLLDDPALDAVVICSSTDTHAPMIEAAAEAGKHIFCEKPIAFDLATIDRALAIVARAGVTLQIGFNRRFDASYRRVREAILKGEIGEPHLLHLISRDPAPPPLSYIATSGGLFLDMTIHDFDMARFLIGSEVETVYTAAAVRVDEAIGAAGDLDTAVVLLTFENGVIGTIDNSRRAVYGYDQRVEVFGSGGSVQSSNAYPNTVTLQTAQHVHRDLPLHFFLERYAESFLAEMKAFAAAVLEGSPTPVSGLDGRAPVAIALAARQSYDEKHPVRVPNDRPLL